jgi:hypothetical protein
MRQEEWHYQRDEAMKKEVWSLHGPNRIVKVVPISRGPAHDFWGYITVAKSIRGMTSVQIERVLGFESFSLASGAVIYSFARLPDVTDYSYELTADKPDGLAPTFMGDPRYPSGSKRIHQWRIREDRPLPIAIGSEVRLNPGDRFPG